MLSSDDNNPSSNDRNSQEELRIQESVVMKEVVLCQDSSEREMHSLLNDTVRPLLVQAENLAY